MELKNQTIHDVLMYELKGTDKAQKSALSSLEAIAKHYNILLRPKQTNKTVTQLAAELAVNKQGLINLIPEMYAKIK
jgi:hypothetical protein